MVRARPRLRLTASAAALAAAAALGAPWASAADGAAVPSATALAPQVSTVVLPTGDRVEIAGSGAHARYTQLPSPSGGKTTLMSFDNGAGDHYMIPDEAAPFIGRGLDARLFDVARPAAGPDGRIPVSLGFAAGTTPTAPAGVTLTSVGASTAAGYLTPASAPAFAAALRQRIGADVAAGRAPGSSGLPDGLTSVAPAAAAPPTVTPHYPLHILQVNTLDLNGAPADFTMLLITNTDSARMFNTMTPAYGGVARIAVPAGHYSIWSIQSDYDEAGGSVTARVTTVDGFSMAATGVTTVTADARAATVATSVTTERPATPDGAMFSLVRQAADGTSIVLGLGAGPDVATYFSPTDPPQIGKFALQEQWFGAGPASPDPYRYALDFEYDHVPADLAVSSDDADLATVVHDFANDPSFGTAMPTFMEGTEAPLGAGSSVMGEPLSALGPLTVYTTPGRTWLYEVDEESTFTEDAGFVPGAMFFADPVVFQPGQSVTRDWLHAPVAPRFGQHPEATSSPYGCQACVGEGSLFLALSQIGDSNPDTTGLDFVSPTDITVSWNGQQLISGPYLGAIVPGIPAGPGTIEEVMDVDRTPTGVSQATKSHTDVVIPYSGQTDPQLALPAGTLCEISPTAVCQILPALTLDYTLHALNDANTSHAAVENLGLDVGHLSYGQYGSTAAITSAQVSVSFDGGATWQNVPTHGAAGHYDAHWTNPAAGSHLTLRVTATDALGGSISQTITDPYTAG